MLDLAGEKKMLGPELVQETESKIIHSFRSTEVLCKFEEKGHRVQCRGSSIFDSVAIEESSNIWLEGQVEPKFY
ncbi:hypothetical protein EPI10_031707 [Gossypium australe]|uniref:Uncharacterized protein n=1 Tax=Gossypium australe TaxID=47621 RepID=A0A5B6X459_9ROSI|nr:hypothetical protein EPI10_031707 [Gossypium australe]